MQSGIYSYIIVRNLSHADYRGVSPELLAGRKVRIRFWFRNDADAVAGDTQVTRNVSIRMRVGLMHCTRANRE